MIPQTNNNYAITKFLLIETRQYQDPVRRTYNIRTDGENLDRLERMVRPYGDLPSRMNDIAIATEIPNLIGLSGQGQIPDIPYGWGEKRLRFLMEVRVQSDISLEEYIYIQGYTNYFDKSISGMIDPQTEFYVNSLTTVKAVRDRYNNGLHYSISEAVNLFTNHSANSSDVRGYGGYGFDSLAGVDKTIRPIDIVTGINSLPNANEYVTIDTTSTTESLKVSKRENNNPTRYLNKTMNSFIDSYPATAAGYGSTDMSDNAMRHVTERPVESNPFMKVISDYLSVPDATRFRLADLLALDPHLLTDNTRTQLILRDDEPINFSKDYTVLDSDVTENLFQPTIETLMAQEAVLSLTDVAIKNFLTNLVISFTNRTQPDATVIIQELQTFIQFADEIRFCQIVESFVRSVLLPKMTMNNQLEIECMISFSLTGDSSVSIGYNGQPPTLFRFPTFADGTYSPIICSQHVYGGVIDDFNNLLTTVGINPQVVDPLNSLTSSKFEVEDYY